MDFHDAMLLALLLLAATIVAVPLSKMLRVGSIVGYLFIGALIAPIITQWVGDTDVILHFAEIGVVLFLFLTGLEINPRTLWSMRLQVFGLGSLQMLLCTALFALLAWWLSPSWQVALVLGLCLAFSSTAIALQNLNERGELVTPSGRLQLAILLLQDMAVVPALALVVFLSPATGDESLHWSLSVGKQVAAVAALYVVGKYLLNPVLDFLARWNARDLFSAVALFIVLGAAALMDEVGISMALGGFIAGFVCSESEYRHQLESNIQPFKSIILAIFFLAVGMTISWQFLMQNYAVVFGLCILYLLIKVTILFLIARIGKLQNADSLRLAFNLSQGSEFAFVVIQAATNKGLVSGFYGDMITLLVCFSMIISAVMVMAIPTILRYLQPPTDKTKQQYDKIDSDGAPVILVGFGRFGQILARVLHSQKIPFVAIEKDAAQVKMSRRFVVNYKIYHGDPTHLSILHSAQADKARCIAICVDEPEVCVKIVQIVQKHFPHLKILARVRNRQHAQRLFSMGVPVNCLYREMFDSSMAMTTDLLKMLDFSDARSDEIAHIFRDFDIGLLREDSSQQDEKEIRRRSKSYHKELESLFQRDQKK